MILIKKKNYYDYSKDKNFEFIFNKLEQKVYSVDVGILELCKPYFLKFGTVVLDKIYCPNVVRVQYHILGRKSPQYMDCVEFIRLLWLSELEKSGL